MKLDLPALITGLLAAHANAWAVASYSGATCNSDASFNNVNYEGFSQGGDGAPYPACTVVGDPVDGCTQYTDSGNGPFTCTGPMTPAPGSVYIPANSECIVTWGTECLWPPWPLDSDTCFDISRLPNGNHDTAISFKCRAAP